ncbi:HD domain-containing protein [Halobacteriovorax sp. GB3]|uniref:HD-GYP domain-containing protein n=1 Tax=Halobacteriovorax sp. GB3 TaxID=2719615 RepID=UPI002360DE2B|nr:HD domain-containing phosphohydrolase [Halobacteriovorax sp. GB3]MDD0852682.1 HD domain-containing protein [Halobacteriovorax sp. GB3]
MSKKFEKKVARYEELMKLSQLTSSSLDIKDIKKKACTIIAKLLQCEKVLIYRYDQKKNKLIHRFWDNHESREWSCELDEKTFVGSCGHFMATLHIRDAKVDLRSRRDNPVLNDFTVKEVLVFPLINKGELVGVVQSINSSHDEGFNEEDIQFSEAVSSQLTNTLLNTILFEKQQKMFIQVVESMADAIGKKDTYTGGHTKRVRHFSELIGREMDLTFSEMNDLRLAAVLHDIGKIGIEDKILKKSAPLTEDEFKTMREHPRLGYEILRKIEGLESVIDGMRFHHERPDGRGYPYGLKGEEIPLIASIISVADTFDAMISTRPYRKGLNPMIAYQEIIDHSGTQFDPRVVEGFKKYFEKTKMYKPSTMDSFKKAS